MDYDTKPFYIDSTAEELKFIKEKLGEDDERFNNTVAILHDWMAKHPNMPKNYDKRIIPNTLRSCKYDMEKTKRKIVYFYAARTMEPKFTAVLDMSSERMKNVVKSTNIATARKLTPEGYCVQMAYSIAKDQDLLNEVDIAEYLATIHSLYSVEAVPHIGIVTIFYSESFSAASLTKFISPLLFKFAKLWQKGVAQRVVGVHIINSNEYVTTLVNVFKKIFPEKLANRVHFHKNMDDLKNFLTVDDLPIEFGGKEKSIVELSQDFAEHIKNRSDYFKQTENCIYIGEVPKQLDIIDDDVFGVFGSFRKLNLD